MSLTILTVPDRPERFNSFIYNIPKLEEQQVIIAFTDLDDTTRIERIFDVNKYGDGRITFSKIQDYHEKDFPMVDRIERAERTNRRTEKQLFEAVRQQKPFVVRGILKTHISPDCTNPRGQTPLMMAAYYGDTQSVEFILEANPQLNVQDHRGWTALMMAARHGKGQPLDLLLDAGANPDLQNREGTTAMMMGARNGYYHIVKSLLDARANRFLKNQAGLTAAQIADKYINEGSSYCKELNRGDILKLLSVQLPVPLPLEKAHRCANPNQFGDAEAFVIASEYGDLITVNSMLHKNVDPNTTIHEGWSPLTAAARHGHTHIVKRLLDAGANPMTVNKYGRTALYLAEKYRHHDIVALLKLNSGKYQ